MFISVNGGKLPTRTSKYSAGIDVYANENITIEAGETKIIPLGIKIDIKKFVNKNKKIFELNFYDADEFGDNGEHYGICTEKVEKFLKSHYIALKPRSSLRAKGLISHAGVIDLDYKDELKMIIHNPIIDGFIGVYDNSCFLGAENEVFITIHKGDKIGQLLLMEHKSYLFGI